jgi:hypothetical protein
LSLDIVNQKIKIIITIYYLMTLPLDSKNRFNKNNKRLLPPNWSQFAEGWAGVGIIVGIWAVTFGIIASGILKL